MQKIVLNDLLKAGVHFGHKSSTWAPGMKPFLFGVKNGVHLINLEKTKEYLEKAGDYAKQIVAKGGTVLFVGTKPQARHIVEDQAKLANMPYATERWLGGTLTNFKEIFNLVRKLEKLTKEAAAEDYEQKYTKKERLVFSEEMEKLQLNIGGIVNMKKIPDAVFITSVRQEKVAFNEAKKMGIPIIGVCDSNVKPNDVDYVIPANDDATKSITYIVSYLSEAIRDGHAEYEEMLKNQPQPEIKKVAPKQDK